MNQLNSNLVDENTNHDEQLTRPNSDRSVELSIEKSKEHK